jgi:hypothetical protein
MLAQSDLAEDHLDLRRPITYLPILAAVALVLVIYSYPTLMTTSSTGSRVLPPVTSPDTSLYLNISKMKAPASEEVVDPYYAIPVLTPQMGYLKFRTAFLLFAGLNTLMRGDTWWALLVWNIFWWALLCVVAGWFFEHFLPHSSLLVVFCGIATLMFFNFGVLQSELGAWRLLPSLHGFESVELPFIRPFFPQLPIPLLLLYLGLQIKALQKTSWPIWIAMAVTQFVTFTIFPYAMLMMAGISAIAIAGMMLSDGVKPLWRFAVVYGALCGASDFWFLIHGSHVSRTGPPGQDSLIHLQGSMLARHMGGTWFLLFALTLAVGLFRGILPVIKWPVVGLGLSNLLLLLGDVLFSEAALQISHHAGYFVHLTVTVMLVLLAAQATEHLHANRSVVWRIGLAGILAALTFNGLFISLANYRRLFLLNNDLVEFAQILRASSPEQGDLIIARALTVDDNCAWVSLLSRAHSLFCRNAQVLLSPEQNQNIQRFRQALYLYFSGKNRSWAEGVLNDANNETELSRLMFLGEYSSDAKERNKHVDSTRAGLIPFLTKIESNDREVHSFLSSYQRILVIDSVSRPTFAEDKLSTYLRVEGRKTSGSFVVLNCRPLP